MKLYKSENGKHLFMVVPYKGMYKTAFENNITDYKIVSLKSLNGFIKMKKLKLIN